MLDHYLYTGYTASRLLNPTRDPITLTPPQPGTVPEHPTDLQQALDWFTTEHAVLLAAADHAATTGFDTHTWQLAWTLDTFLERRGHWHDWAATQQAAVAAAARLADLTAHARAHRYLARAYGRLDRFDDAYTHLRHALDLYGQAGDLAGQGHARLLDGTRGEDAIAIAVGDLAPPAEVYYRLRVMEERGYLESADDDDTTLSTNAFWSDMGLDGRAAVQRLAPSAVALEGVGDVDLAACAEALREAGTDVDCEASITLVVTDDYLHPALEEFNTRALAEGRPWLLAKPGGTVIWVGPIFRHGEAGCWECLAQRLRGNREVESYVRQRLDKAVFAPATATLAAATALGVRLAAIEVARWLAAGPIEGSLEGILLTLDLATMQTRRHQLVRLPQCARCGGGGAPIGEPGPLYLETRRKRFVDDGGHRAVPPEETLARYAHHVSPLIGAVTELKRSAAADDPLLHVYVSGHNFALRSGDLGSLRRGLRSNSAGKGASDVQAQASALCEALERYSGVFRGDEPRVRSTYRRLGGRGIHPNACMLFSDRQLRERDAWNARKSNFQVVPRPFDEEREDDWTPVWSLTSGEVRFLPTGYLYYGYPAQPGTFDYWADSNGNSAGNCLEEAILHGFLELVERDAVAIWWYSRVRRPQVDLGSFDDDWIDAVARRYVALDRPLWVLDLTSDFGIPVFGAISRRIDKPAEDILVAFGAHLDPRIALRRAVNELNQFLPAVIHVGRDGGDYAFDDPESLAWWRTATIAEQTYLVPDPSAPQRTLGSFPMLASDDLREDVLACQELVEQRGLEFLVHNQTRPDIGLPTAKVIVPGMRHFWARFAPGRLYNVAVELGWVPRPLSETDLNPIALFI
jgi:ribosomal protein S12 methylthiotransferase accessory factor